MTAYLFDIDGVITDPDDRIIKHPELVSYIVSFLSKGDPVGLVSGRAIVWQIERVVTVIEQYVRKSSLPITVLDNLFVSGEFGGSLALHEGGKRVETIDKTFALSNKLFDRLKKESKQFKQYVFFDKDKKTHVSLEMNAGSSETEFGKHKEHIAEDLRHIVGDNPEVKVLVDRIAINVKHKNANKHSATAQFIAWLTKKNLHPEKYYVFGDSPTDLEIGEELHAHKRDVFFVYVGYKTDLLGKHPAFPVTVTNEHCDRGTVEFLKSQSLSLLEDKGGSRRIKKAK